MTQTAPQREVMAERLQFPSATQALLESIGCQFPQVCTQLVQQRDLTIGQYLSDRLLFQPRPNPWRDDFFQVVEAETLSHYGARTAAKVMADLKAYPMVLTANHHGIDTFADSVQATLTLALWQRRLAHRPTTLTVLACSSVSLSNPTYPAGIRIYNAGHNPPCEAPRRVRIFPHSKRHCLVSAAAPYTNEMIVRTGNAVRALERSGALSPEHTTASLAFVEQSLGGARALAGTSFLHQAQIVNGELWSRLGNGKSVSDLVFLEFESIAGQLVQRDLTRSESLVCRLLLDAQGRRSIVAILDGATACWSRASFRGDSGVARDATSSGGTMMFWGVGTSGQRYPLELVDEGAVPVLRGSDNRGAELCIELQADQISDALADGRIIPSLFTSFLVLALQRDLICVGGYYQSQYLPTMQQGVVRALRQMGDEGKLSGERVESVHAACCLSALQPFAQINRRGNALPAGPIEIVASNVSLGAVDALLEVPVVEATQIALMDLASLMAASGDLMTQLSNDLAGTIQRAVCVEL